MLSTQPLSGLIEDITDSLKSANKSDEFVIQGDAEVEEVEGEVDPATSASMSEVLPSDVSTEVARVAKTSDSNKGQMDNFIAACWRKVDTHVLLLQEGADASSLCDRLKGHGGQQASTRRAGKDDQRQALRPDCVRFEVWWRIIIPCIIPAAPSSQQWRASQNVSSCNH